MEAKKALVIGSVNVDSTYGLKNLPVLGETILAQDKHESMGGKGLNQAVALRRMGLETTFMAAIGNDQAGEEVLAHLAAAEIGTEHIVEKDSDTGQAIILVDEQGDNMIIPFLGANDLLSKEDIEANLAVFDGIDVCVLQLEIPIPTIEYIIDYCAEKGIKVVLNPAPATTELSWEALKKVEYLVPNETELQIITGKTVSLETIDEIGKEVIAKGVQRLVVTMGEHGAYYYDAEQNFRVKPKKVDVVDTTAAGDTFVGAFVSRILKEDTPEEAMNFANKAASITISRKGASDSIPDYTEV